MIHTFVVPMLKKRCVTLVMVRTVKSRRAVVLVRENVGVKCAACGSSTKLCSSHRDCQFNKSRANKEPHSDNSRNELIADSESDEAMSDTDLLGSGEGMSSGGSSDSKNISCTCVAERRAHKRDCPLSPRNCISGRNLFPAPSEPEAHIEPSELESANPPPSPQETNNMKPEMTVGDYVCIHSRRIQGFHILCCIVGEFSGQYQLYCTKGVLNTFFLALSLFQ